VVICLERGADLHTAQLMPLPLTISCFSEIQIGFAFLVPTHLGSPGQRAVKRACVRVLLSVYFTISCVLFIMSPPIKQMGPKARHFQFACLCAHT